MKQEVLSVRRSYCGYIGGSSCDVAGFGIYLFHTLKFFRKKAFLFNYFNYLCRLKSAVFT